MKMLIKFWPILIPLGYYIYYRLKNKKLNKKSKLALLKRTFYLTLFVAVFWLIINAFLMEKEGFEEYIPETINMYNEAVRDSK